MVSVVILTRDEEIHLSTCLSSLADLDCEVFVVDSGSQDRTVEVARGAGATVVSHPFENWAAQLNWALESLPLHAAWTMRLDADERLTPELVAEMQESLPQVTNDIGAILIRRRVYFWGRWIRHGGYYPIWLLRVWRTGKATCEQRWMDEHMVVQTPKTLALNHDMIDENLKGLGFWTEKHNWYAECEVKELLASRANRGSETQLLGQAARTRWLKENVYSRCPLFTRALLYWIYRYVFRLGFLDGQAGLVFHFLQGFWYRFLVDAKLRESELYNLASHRPGNQGLGNR